MPLTASFSWRQTPNEVLLDVPLRGCSPDAVDVTVADVLLKVSFPPYLITVDLLHEVNPDDARLVLDRGSGTLSVVLPKAAPGDWEDLAYSAEQDELEKRRAEALEREFERQRAASQARAATAGAQERTAMQQQMAVEDRQRAVLQQRQQEEKETAQADAVRTLQQISQASSAAQKAASAAARAAAPAAEAASSSSAQPPQPGGEAAPAAVTQAAAAAGKGKGKSKAILPAEDDEAGPGAGAAAARAALVPPRATQSVAVSFTARAFPTPLRESRAREEEDWLAKNYLKLKQGAANSKAAAAGQEPGRPFVEKDPAWLKDKGNGFVQAGDWPSAEAAYSAALDADKGLVDVQLNRALARLHQDKTGPCTEDCAQVVCSLLGIAPAAPGPALHASLSGSVGRVPSLPVKARGQVLKALGRTCLAHLRAGAYGQAAQAMQTLLLVDSEQEVGSEAFLTSLQTLAGAEHDKVAGDGRVRAGDPAGAVDRYDAALQRQPQYVQALLNKSAVLHSQCKWAECEAACRAVADLLSQAAPWSAAQLDGDAAPIPFAGTALHQQCKVRAEARLADSRAKLEASAAGKGQQQEGGAGAGEGTAAAGEGGAGTGSSSSAGS